MDISNINSMYNDIYTSASEQTASKLEKKLGGDYSNATDEELMEKVTDIMDVAKQLKQRKAKRIYAAATFGLFTSGLDKFDEAYEEGILNGVLTTNLIYQTPELLSKPYYINCDMSKYLALLIDTLNHDSSIGSILDPADRIQHVVNMYNNSEEVLP